MAVDIKNISYYYGDNPVLKNLSFSVREGDFFIIIGPNGSGKTTLMNAVSGILNCQEGRVEIFGRSIQSYNRKDLAKTIAFVPQIFPVDFPFSVTEMVLMGRSPHLGIFGLEKEEDIKLAKQAMNFTEVKHLAHRKLNQLSGGERQRVFIARAICQEPQVILLDEPTASLDLAHQVKIMDLMYRLKREKGMTIIMVSHDLNLAAMYGDRLLLLNRGQAVSLGLPQEVLTLQKLEATYRCRLLVDESPLGKFPRITLVPQKHVMAGTRGQGSGARGQESGMRV
jgi:iron complex transport system ATP-binding protein